MINDQVQRQEAGDGSTNLQGQQIIINQGISYTDAKEIALDVYKANFLQLSNDAAAVASRRAEELTDRFLEKLKAENENAISSLSHPGMQMALYQAQKFYAATGDKDIEELLVTILVDRASHNERTLKQITLDESLSVASKLTTEQLDALTINFLISKTMNQRVTSLPTLSNYIASDILPFLDSLEFESSAYEHLAYTGCGSIMEAAQIHPVEYILRNQYKGVFSKGFDLPELEAIVGVINPYNQIIIRCIRDNSKLQINALNDEVFEERAGQFKIDQVAKEKLKQLFETSTMNQKEVKVDLLKIHPRLDKLFQLWEKTNISKFTLTTVGIAIAQANFKRRTNASLDLGIWVK